MITRAVLGSLTVHDLADPTIPYAIDTDGLTGLGEPSIRISAYERAGEDGGHIASAYHGMRAVALSGVVRGSDAASFMANRRALEQTAFISRDSNGRPVLTELTVTTHDGSEFVVSCLVRKINVGIVHNNYAPFLIELLCPDPYLLSTTQTSSGQVSRPISTGANFPWVFDPTIEFGTTSGGVVNVNNPGSADTWPVVTFRGPLTNPVIRHVATGKYVQLETTLSASDSLVIDMRQKTIVLNDAANYLYTRTIGSEWFSLAPGNNLLSFNTGSVSDSGTAEITYFAAYIGV